MLEDHLTRVFSALARSEVRYLVVGGLAVTAHGHPRMTADLDLVIALDPDNVQRAMEALRMLGYRPQAPVSLEAFADPQIRMSWVREKGMQVFQLVSETQRETAIDVFVEEPFDFGIEYARAPRLELVEGQFVPVVNIDTLIAMKQRAGRPRDLEDVRQLRLLRELGGG